MSEIFTVGIDLAKNVFQAHGANASGRAILRGDALWREADVAQRWRSVVMRERNFSQQDSVAFLAYRVSADRGDAPIYQALYTSTYPAHDGRWLRLTHQQTPVWDATEG